MGKEITRHIQDCFVKLLITDTDFLSICRQSIEPHFFSSDIIEQVVQCCFNFYDQFKKHPGDNIHDEITKAISGKSRDKKELFVSYLTKVANLKVANVDYIYRSVMDWITQKRFETAAYEFVNLVSKGDTESARQLMYASLKHDYGTEHGGGLNYAEVETPTYLLNDEKDRLLFRSNIKHLDRYIRGFTRSQLVTILGPAKGKKTWFLIHLGKQAIKRGLTIIHISHEITEQEVEMRYDQAIGSLVHEEEDTEVEFLRRNRKGKITKRYKKIRPSVYTTTDPLLPRRTVRKMGAQLIIKKYPMSTMNIAELERYLNWLEIFKGIIPDVIIDDYVEITDLPKDKEERNRINKAYIQRKRIADERNLLFITASQTSKAGWGKKVIDMDKVSEDYRKIANVDMCLGIGATKEQIDEDVCTIFVAAIRGRKGKVGCFVQSNLDVGQFHLSSWPMYRKKRAQKSEDVEDENDKKD